jgi:hypothetical protein
LDERFDPRGCPGGNRRADACAVAPCSGVTVERPTPVGGHAVAGDAADSADFQTPAASRNL